MKTLTRMTIVGGVALLAGTLAFAGGSSQATTQLLKDAKQRLASKAVGEKGGPKGNLMMEQRRLGDLIDDLEAGKRVDPSEIDRALERANRF